MKSVVKMGRTVDEAIEEALRELRLQREDVTVDILSEPSKGLFGIFKTKDAKVRVTATNDPVEIANNFISMLFNKMRINAELDIFRDKSELVINIKDVNNRDMGVIIGKRGKTLDSIQYLVSLVVNKERKNYLRVILDIENYRKKREETLIRLAKKMAEKAKILNKSIKLEPMNPYERRIIHATLQNDPYVITYSEGEEPNRRVIIESK